MGFPPHFKGEGQGEGALQYTIGMTSAQDIAALLLRTGAVRISINDPFTWTSGIKAPIYCDVRKLYGHPPERARIVDALLEAARCLPVMPEGIAGTATAAIGWAALVAVQLDLPFAYVRPVAKEHGTRKRVEGDLPKGKRILVIEDLLSTAGSAVATVAALREECAADVSDIAAIFSYELPSAFANARRHRLRLHPLATRTDLLAAARESGMLSAQDDADIRTFFEAPEEWWLKRSRGVPSPIGRGQG